MSLRETASILELPVQTKPRFSSHGQPAIGTSEGWTRLGMADGPRQTLAPLTLLLESMDGPFSDGGHSGSQVIYTKQVLAPWGGAQYPATSLPPKGQQPHSFSMTAMHRSPGVTTGMLFFVACLKPF